MDNLSMVSMLVNASRIKYAVLDDILKKKRIPNGTINFMIDGYALFERFYSAGYYSDLDHVDEGVFVQEFVSAALNTLAHYRRYFATRLKRPNRIFIIWNQEYPDYQLDLNDEYGESYFAKFCYEGGSSERQATNKAIKTALGFLREMVQYFDGIYYINSDGVEDHAVVRLLMKQYPDAVNFLFTKNDIWLQFCSNRTFIIRPNRDKSRLITGNNIGKYIFRKTKYTTNNIDPDNIRHILSVAGVKSRDISPVGGYRIATICKGIDKLVDKGTYLDNMNFRRFMNELNTVLKKPYLDSEIDKAEANFRCIDAKHALLGVPKGKWKKILQSRIDLYDMKGLVELNEAMSDADDVIKIMDLSMSGLEAYNPEYNPLDDELNTWQYES